MEGSNNIAIDDLISSRRDTETMGVLETENISTVISSRETASSRQEKTKRTETASEREKKRWSKPRMGEVSLNYQRYSMQEFDQRSNRYKKIGICKDNQTLIQFGSGVYLFFSWMKQLTIVFGVMSLFAAVSVYCTTSSNYLQSAEVSTPFDYTTIANMATYKIIQTDGSQTSTISSEEILSLESKRVTVYFMDLLITLTFFIFTLVFRYRLKADIRKCEQQTVTISDYAVEIKNIPPNATEAEVAQMAIKYGSIYEVKIARDFKGTFKISQEISGLELEVKRNIALFKLLPRSRKLINKKIRKIRKIIADKRKKVMEILKVSGLSIRDPGDFPGCRAFIIFDHTSSRNEMIKDFLHQMRQRRLSKFCLCCKSNPQLAKFKLCGKDVSVEIPEEPSNIRFENLGATRWQRFYKRLITLSIIFLVLVIALILMYALSKAQGYQSIQNCKEVYTFDEIAANPSLSSNKDIIFCYCSKQKTQTILAQPSYTYCREYIIERSTRQAFNFGVSILEVIAGLIVRVVIGSLTKNMLFTKVSKEMTSITYFIFYSDIINFTTIIVLMRCNFNGFKPAVGLAELLTAYTPSLANQNKLYSSFNTSWYIDIGGKITNRFILFAIFPYVLWIIMYPIGKCWSWWRARKAKLHFDAIKETEPKEFEMSEISSKILSQVFLCFMWCAGIPILILFTFAGLVISYFVVKWASLNYFKRPPQIDHNFILYTAKFMPLCIIIHCFLSVLLYNMSEVFNLPEKYKLPAETQVNLGFFAKFDYRQHYLYYIIGSLSLAIFTWDFVIVKILNLFFSVEALKVKLLKQKQITNDAFDIISFEEASRFLSHTSLTSYDIKKNSQYRDIMISMKFDVQAEEIETPRLPENRLPRITTTPSPMKPPVKLPQRNMKKPGPPNPQNQVVPMKPNPVRGISPQRNQPPGNLPEIDIIQPVRVPSALKPKPSQ